jgi:hypothetical protein
LTPEGQLKIYQRDLTLLTQKSEAETSKRVDKFFIGPLDWSGTKRVDYCSIFFVINIINVIKIIIIIIIISFF